MYSTEEKICILFGQLAISAKKFYKLLDYFGDAICLSREIFNNQDAEQIVGEEYRALCSALKDGKLLEQTLARMQDNGIVAVTCFSPNFPSSVRDLEDPPYVFFCKGDVALLNSKCLAVVGTRKVSSYGRRLAKDFTAILSENFTIVSGLAYGVDSIAHETCLEHNGKTIAVLGGGIIKVYPSANQQLADRIVEQGGLLISEYGIDAQPAPYRFPHRNRIVAGLSVGLFVCQAPLKSGTFSTVECALEQGKDVFVVPGEVYDVNFSGSNSLIKSMQGACVTTPRDIESFYHLDVQKKQKAVVQLSIFEQKIVDVVSVGKVSFDEIVQQTGIQPQELNFLLANLELKSIIARLPGNCYRLYGGIE